ncbi:hypothetical protein LCGC14_0404270 [marine sediment metagenome]|uniref:DUF551 domain-containing protein n=1 Tax=marine sediment metagenome TaxID=412755 RepID=A0A0F9W4Z3_9ZZZZ
MKWISVMEGKPTGCWDKFHPDFSEEVLVANSCCVTVAYYNRNIGVWYTGEPTQNEKYKYLNWIDKITHWMPLPKNPHKGDTK